MNNILPVADRSIAVDVARGLAIVGVVFNHAVIGLESAAIVSAQSTLANFNDDLYLFRMAALVFLLGLFIPRSVAKRGIRGYLWHRLPLLIWLYVVWYFVQGSIELATTGVKNNPVSLTDLAMFWIPPAQLWFLPFLAVITVIVAVAQPWRRTTAGALLICAAIAISILTWGWLPNYIGIRGFPLIVFATIGAAIGLGLFRRAAGLSVVAWVAFGLTSLVAFTFLARSELRPATGSRPGIDLSEQTLSFAAAVLGVVLLLSLAVTVARVRPINRCIAYLGRHTLEIFVAHIVVTAGVRILMVRVGVVDVLPHVIAGVGLGVALPILLARLAGKVHAHWLFGTPEWLDRNLPLRTTARGE